MGTKLNQKEIEEQLKGIEFIIMDLMMGYIIK